MFGAPGAVRRRQALRIIKSPEFRQRMADIGADPIGDSPEQMAQTIKNETEKFGKLVKDANVVIE
jgi:tripartite-type tricarboxylate transporter receptor subunit TctC